MIWEGEVVVDLEFTDVHAKGGNNLEHKDNDIGINY